MLTVDDVRLHSFLMLYISFKGGGSVATLVPATTAYFTKYFFCFRYL